MRTYVALLATKGTGVFDYVEYRKSFFAMAVRIIGSSNSWKKKERIRARKSLSPPTSLNIMSPVYTVLFYMETRLEILTKKPVVPYGFSVICNIFSLAFI